ALEEVVGLRLGLVVVGAGILADLDHMDAADPIVVAPERAPALAAGAGDGGNFGERGELERQLEAGLDRPVFLRRLRAGERCSGASRGIWHGLKLPGGAARVKDAEVPRGRASSR